MAAYQPTGPVYRQAGTILTEHTFPVPLDHRQPDGEQIEVFAREVTAPARSQDRGHDAGARPWLVFLQGGPGFGALRPSGRESWLDRALDDFRVLLLDQRGTGRSSPVSTGKPWPGWPARGPRLTTWRTSAPTRSSGTPS